MTDTIAWEPPIAGTDVETLLGHLERLRATFAWKCDGLDRAGLDARVGVSTITLGGLLKHLAACEDHKFQRMLHGRPMPAVWEPNGWDDDDDWEWHSAAHDSPEALTDLWVGATDRSRTAVDEALADGGLDRLTTWQNHLGERFSLRRLLVDMVEEYARHIGHADLIRETVDGRVGEDPPPDWPIRTNQPKGER